MKKDLRARKSERAIREAFWELLGRKELDKITVNEICEKAEISRNTFYDHYEDKYLLMESLAKEFCREMVEGILVANVGNQYESASKATAWLLYNELNDQKDNVQIFTKNYPLFWEDFSDELQNLMLTYSGEDERNTVFAIYSTGALISCYREFFSGRIRLSAEKFVAYVVDIAIRCNEFMRPGE